jgi:hypothetical protein
MPDDTETKGTFLNRRDWTSYLTALQSATVYPRVLESVYPRVLEAVNSGCAWFSEGATHASNWLVDGSRSLRDKFSAG